MFKKTVLTLVALAAAFLALAPANADAQASFSAAFTPDTIGPGSTSKLTFTINNIEGGPTTNLAFTATLPAGVTIATPAQAQTDCTGPSLSLTAPDGGNTITLSGGRVGAGEICTVMVNVVGVLNDGTNAEWMLTSGDLTSSAGNSGTASATLNVRTDLPGFTKSFSPATIDGGQRSTLTFTFNNTANTARVGNLDFTDILPTGLVVANPPNVFTDAVSAGNPDTTVIASPGSNSITLDANGNATTPGFEVIPANATRTLSVDVVATGTGRLENVAGELLADFITAGKAGAVLDVNTPADLLFTKSFIDDPVTPGDTVTLEFTIQNLSRTDAATGISFTDDLTTVLAGLTATLPPSPDPPCGAGSTLTGSAGDTLLTLAGGTLAPEETCTFQVTLNVPGGATAGSYPNVTSDLTATVGGIGVVVPGASDSLFINNAPLITKTFLDDPVVAGGSTRMEFTITNTSSTSSATDITFIDDLTAWLPFPVSVDLPPTPDPPCGPGSSLSLISLGTDEQGLQLTGGELAPGASCTFEVTVNIPIGLASGFYTNTTEPISATVDGGPVTGKTATDQLEVIGGVTITKEFTDDPVAPGGTATLEFTLSLDVDAPGDATNIAFTDNLNDTLTGMVSSSGTQNDICGTGSSISGTSTLSFTGGTLSPGESCTFSVQVDVPAGADPGFYANTTSNVTATISTLETQGQPATDDLLVTGLTFSKEFLTDPVIPGGTTTLRFTLDNSNGAQAADITFFTDNLEADLPGLAATGPPTFDDCGGDMSGTTFLTYVGGSVPAGQVCTIEVPVMVPGGAANNTYRNQTSNLSVTIDGNSVSLPPATDELTVTDTLLLLTKEFVDDPVAPDGTGTLEFTLTNLDPDNPATGIGFTDDLDATLTGLESTSGSVDDVCGLGSEISGTGVLTLTGGSLGAGESCTFSVQVKVPAGATAGSYPNTTSNVTGTINALPITGDPASDNLEVGQITFTKQFVPGSVVPDGIATLQFTIANNSSDAISSIGFTDDLDAMISGATAIGTPIADVCGAGSSLAGSSLLTLTGGSLLPGGSCTFSVDIQIPPGAALGTATNTTSDLLVLGVSSADPATADLTVNPPPPAFTKAFLPDVALPGDVVTLTFTIDNSASTVAATAFEFTDTLPAGLEIADPPNPISDCPAGMGDATAGATTFTFTGGTVPAGATCTIQFDVTVTAASPLGIVTNTSGDLTSSAGNSGTATANLYVDNAGDTPGEALDITADIAAGAVSLPGVLRSGDVDYFTFTFAGTTRLALGTASSLDTFGQLFDDGWNLVNDPAADSNAGAGNNFLINQLLPAGTYFLEVNGDAADDGPYNLEAVEVPLTFQPDMKIGKRLNRLKGDNIYNGNSVGQKVVIRGRAKRGRNHRYFFACENDGEAVDDFLIGRIGKRYNNRKWRARIFRISGGRRNVTGAFETRSLVQTLAPGQEVFFRVVVSLKSSSSRRIRRGFGERAFSGSDLTKFDTTRARFVLRP